MFVFVKRVGNAHHPIRAIGLFPPWVRSLGILIRLTAFAFNMFTNLIGPAYPFSMAPKPIFMPFHFRYGLCFLISTMFWYPNLGNRFSMASLEAFRHAAIDISKTLSIEASTYIESTIGNCARMGYTFNRS